MVHYINFMTLGTQKEISKGRSTPNVKVGINHFPKFACDSANAATFLQLGDGGPYFEFQIRKPNVLMFITLNDASHNLVIATLQVILCHPPSLSLQQMRHVMNNTKYPCLPC